MIKGRNPKSEMGNPNQARIPKAEDRCRSRLVRISDFTFSPPKPLRHCLSAIFVFAWLIRLSASELETGFDQANKLFERGKYAEAAAAYEKLIAAGHVSPSLYFNLGNAFFKAGQPGRAIVAYRQAELLTPRDPDVQANLAFVRKSINQSVAPGEWWRRWLTQFTVDEWSLAASLGLCLCFVLLAAQEARPAWRERFRKPLLSVSAATVLAGTCLWLVWTDRFGARSAVVVVTEAVVRQGPFEESPSRFQLRDGAEVAVFDEKDEWLAVRDASRHEGWLRRSQVAIPTFPGTAATAVNLKAAPKI